MARSSTTPLVPVVVSDTVITRENEIIARINDLDAEGAVGGFLGLLVKDEGGSLSTVATSIDFVGAGVVATGSGATKTITIPGGTVSSTGNANQDGVLRTVSVSTFAALTAAVLAAIPGDNIEIAPGDYTATNLTGILAATSGTKANPIRVIGLGAVTITHAGVGANTGISLTDNDWWIFENIELRTFNQGVMLVRSDHNTFRFVRSHGMTAECIHVRSGRWNLFEDCWAYDSTNGEGFYIGTDQGSWASYTDDGVGTAAVADYTIVRRARAWNCLQECLEIKENTTGCIVEDSYFDHTGERVDSTFVAGNTVKGNGNIIRRNTSIHINRYAWHTYNGAAPSVAASNNIFEQNTVDASSPVVAVVAGFQMDTTGNRVKTSNTITSGTLSSVATEA